jgi:muramoyltetrapeptide carboxypeptidase
MAQANNAADLIVPPALRPGDAVSLIAPSGPIDIEAYARAVEQLGARGLRCVTYRDVTTRLGYLAGDDESRATELTAAIADERTRAILPIRGGYGVSRLLARVDLSPLAKLTKLVCGFSDITALHLAIHKQAGLATFHTPNLQDGIGSRKGLSGSANRYYWECLMGTDIPLDDALAEENTPAYKIQELVPGTCHAPIVGGNLAVICGLMGTPYDVDCRGKILFIEDIGEKPYRVDRMLSQLALAGKFHDAAGVILGDFSDCDPEDNDKSLPLDAIFEHYFAALDIPVATGLSTGHCRPNYPIPLGLRVRLNTSLGHLFVEEALDAIDPLRPRTVASPRP